MKFGYAVLQLVKALFYKPEVCAFDSGWIFLIFSLAFPFGLTLSPRSTQTVTEMNTGIFPGVWDKQGL